MGKFTVKSHRFREDAVDNMKCPSCGGPAEAEREAPSWRPEMALPVVRRQRHAFQRRGGQGARGLCRLAALARDAGRYAGRGRTFRRRAALFWPIWLMPEVVDEVFRVVYVDGIWIARDCVVLIALQRRARAVVAPRARRDDRRVALAARASPRPTWWSPTAAAASPGGRGRMAEDEGPEMRVPRVLPGQDNTTSIPSCRRASSSTRWLVELLHVETLQQADWWVERFMQWCEFWSDFLEQKSLVEGRIPTPTAGCARGRGSSGSSTRGRCSRTSTRRCAQRGRCPPPTTGSKGANSQPGEVLRSHRGPRSSSASRPCSGGATCMSECPKTMADTLRDAHRRRSTCWSDTA